MLEAMYYGESPNLARGGRSGFNQQRAQPWVPRPNTGGHAPSLDERLFALIAEREDEFRIASPPKGKGSVAARRRREMNNSAIQQAHGGLNGSMIGVKGARENPNLHVDHSGRSTWLLRSPLMGMTLPEVTISPRGPAGRDERSPQRTTSSPRTGTLYRGVKYVDEQGYAGTALEALGRHRQHHHDAMNGLQRYPGPDLGISHTEQAHVSSTPHPPGHSRPPTLVYQLDAQLGRDIDARRHIGNGAQLPPAARSVSPQEARFVREMERGRSVSPQGTPFLYYARPPVVVGRADDQLLTSRGTGTPPDYYPTQPLSEEQKHVALSAIQLVLNMTAPAAAETYKRGIGAGGSVALPVRRSSTADAHSFISTAVPGRCSGGSGDLRGVGGWASFHQRTQLVLSSGVSILGNASAPSSRSHTPANSHVSRSRSSRRERLLTTALPRAAALAADGTGKYLTLRRAHLERVVATLGQHFDDWDSLHPLSLEFYTILSSADYLLNACATWQPMGILVPGDDRGSSSSLRVLNVSRRKIGDLLHGVLLGDAVLGLTANHNPL